MESVRAAIITVGDELLLGTSVDTNSAWLSSQLSELGAVVTRHYTVGDSEADIQTLLAQAVIQADVIVFTGGLGPTRDDLTREAVAAFTSRVLVRDPKLIARMEKRFLSHGYASMPDSNLKQADVPSGATVLPNERGTAPGLAFVEGETLVVLLPGVPREMRGIFADHVSREIRQQFGARLAPLFHRSTYTTGTSESALSEAVEAALPAELGPVRVAFLPSLAGVEVRLTAQGSAQQDPTVWLDRISSAIRPALEPYSFAAEGGDITETVFDLLTARGSTLAVAESCTGGLLAKRLTDRPGASQVFRGGVVAYENAVKTELVGVDPEVIEREGAVSEAVAVQLALGAASRLNADCGIGITGVAGPGGGSAEKPVGTVWIAAAVGEVVLAEHHRFGGDREAVRERSAQAGLAVLVKLLERNP